MSQEKQSKFTFEVTQQIFHQQDHLMSRAANKLGAVNGNTVKHHCVGAIERNEIDF